MMHVDMFARTRRISIMIGKQQMNSETCSPGVMNVVLVWSKTHTHTDTRIYTTTATIISTAQHRLAAHKY